MLPFHKSRGKDVTPRIRGDCPERLDPFFPILSAVSSCSASWYGSPAAPECPWVQRDCGLTGRCSRFAVSQPGVCPHASAMTVFLSAPWRQSPLGHPFSGWWAAAVALLVASPWAWPSVWLVPSPLASPESYRLAWPSLRPSASISTLKTKQI